VRAAIDSGNAEYIAAFAKSDAAGVASVYAPDGARLGPGGQAIVGTAQITEDVRAFLSRTGPIRVGLETVDLWVVGQAAYETGKWSYTFTPQRDPTRTITIGGRYVTIWHQQRDNRWRIAADVGVPGTKPN
jgi:uncharacterized protein (TIGR02246 family)